MCSSHAGGTRENIGSGHVAADTSFFLKGLLAKIVLAETGLCYPVPGKVQATVLSRMPLKYFRSMGVIGVDEISAFKATPVIDTKPCIPRLDLTFSTEVPDPSVWRGNSFD